MSHSNIKAAPLLLENLDLLMSLEAKSSVLDLACGSGRNGRLLVHKGIPVTFADRDKTQLDQLAVELVNESVLTDFWQVDFELPDGEPLADKCFDSILVFNYLHRPLLPAIRAAIRPGGLIFYETFTLAQDAFGRPNNPDYLLQADELQTMFNDWQILHKFEGELQQQRRAVANLIARRPETG
jgi:tellurite methyltransferase